MVQGVLEEVIKETLPMCSGEYAALFKDEFFSLVVKTDGCWGRGDNKKYPWFGFGKYKRMLASRYSYILHYGPFDQSLFVCHKCDNPKCVRPDHLFLGTQKGNMEDMARKGRGVNVLMDKHRNTTHCPSGHPYAGSNLIRRKCDGGRDCRECARTRKIAWRNARRAMGLSYT